MSDNQAQHRYDPGYGPSVTCTHCVDAPLQHSEGNHSRTAERNTLLVAGQLVADSQMQVENVGGEQEHQFHWSREQNGHGITMTIFYDRTVITFKLNYTEAKH